MKHVPGQCVHCAKYFTSSVRSTHPNRVHSLIQAAPMTSTLEIEAFYLTLFLINNDL